MLVHALSGRRRFASPVDKTHNVIRKLERILIMPGWIVFVDKPAFVCMQEYHLENSRNGFELALFCYETHGDPGRISAGSGDPQSPGQEFYPLRRNGLLHGKIGS
jgi:hypothetical protein